MEQWRRFRGEGELTPEIKSKIENFRSHCLEVIHRHFSDLLVELKQEEALEEADSAKLCIRNYRLLNKVPVSLMPYLEGADRSFLSSSAFPVTHYRTVDKQFASLLGFSIARLLTFPMLSFGVNTKETNEVLQQLAGNSSKQETSNAILFYRTVTRDVVCVHWEIAANAVNGIHYGRGVDVTSEAEASRLKQAVGIQKMLRQWLHSIRNASFEQQATVIMEEVKALEAKIEGSQYSAEFQSIYDCVKLLMHTAKTSVGLIDQALDSKGFTQHMCAGDFVSSLVSFPHHFAQSEGLPAIYTKFRFVLDGRVAQPADFLTLFVTGDVVSIQSVVDNILSNAVRYTDPVKGLEVSLSVDRHDGKLNFALKISDFTHGGLPHAALVFLQEGLGVAKCSRSGGYDLQTERDRPVSKGRSSRTGLPHIVESYHHLTESGTDDFDIAVQTSMTGTTFRVRFAMDLMAPVSVTAAAEPLGNIIQGKSYCTTC
jgi:signal transduction histidine kinase